MSGDLGWDIPGAAGQSSGPLPGPPAGPPSVPPPAARPVRRRGPLIALVVGLVGVVFLAAVGISVVAYLSLRPASPSQVVDSYLNAYRRYDVPAVQDLTCEVAKSGTTEQVAKFRTEIGKGVYSYGWLIRDEKISGPVATVTVDLQLKYTSEGRNWARSDPGTYKLNNERGRWRVCEFTSQTGTARPI